MIAGRVERGTEAHGAPFHVPANLAVVEVVSGAVSVICVCYLQLRIRFGVRRRCACIASIACPVGSVRSTCAAALSIALLFSDCYFYIVYPFSLRGRVERVSRHCKSSTV